MEQVTLERMNEEDFRVFRARSVIEYAQDKVKAGAWLEEEALERSEESYAGYLPDGVNTKGHYLYNIRFGEEDSKIGSIWLNVSDAPAGKRAFLYDILIEEAYRGRGLGQAAMKALDDTARTLGAASIGLHVFGHNPAALHVYEKAGYTITDYQMEKKI